MYVNVVSEQRAPIFLAHAFDQSTGPDYLPREVGVTRLVNCVRKSRSARLHQLDDVTSEGQLTMLLGSNHHSILLAGRDTDIAVKYELPTGDVIAGHIDFMDDPNPEAGFDWVPGELKTTRARAGGRPSAHYIEQLASYSVLGNLQRERTLGIPFPEMSCGRLYIVHMTMVPPQVAVFEFHWAKDELLAWHREILRRAAAYFDDTYEPPLEDHYSWECNYCPRFKVSCRGGEGRGDGKIGWFGAGRWGQTTWQGIAPNADGTSALEWGTSPNDVQLLEGRD